MEWVIHATNIPALCIVTLNEPTGIARLRLYDPIIPIASLIYLVLFFHSIHESIFFDIEITVKVEIHSDSLYLEDTSFHISKCFKISHCPCLLVQYHSILR